MGLGQIVFSKECDFLDENILKMMICTLMFIIVLWYLRGKVTSSCLQTRNIQNHMYGSADV